jgi:hypothetical protein
MTPLEILSRARELIADPNKWAQEAMAFSGTKRPVDPDNELAVCWCAAGAVLAVSGNEPENYANIMLLDKGIPQEFPEKHCAMTRVIQYNDSASHAEVLAMFDKAIEACR